MSEGDTLPVLDEIVLGALKDAVGGEAFSAMVVQFEEDLARLRDALNEALSASDADASRETAHALKGAASNIGLNRLSGLAREIEQGTLSGRDAAPRLEAEMTGALSALRAFNA